MTTDESSKDAFFVQLAEISEAMVAAHGKDFTMGALVLAARFIAESETRQRNGSDATLRETARSVSSRVS